MELDAADDEAEELEDADEDGDPEDDEALYELLAAEELLELAPLEDAELGRPEVKDVRPEVAMVDRD